MPSQKLSEKFNLPLIFCSEDDLPVPVLCKPDLSRKGTQLFELTDSHTRTISANSPLISSRICTDNQLFLNNASKAQTNWENLSLLTSSRKLPNKKSSSKQNQEDWISIKIKAQQNPKKESTKDLMKNTSNLVNTEPRRFPQIFSKARVGDQLEALKYYNHSVIFLTTQNNERRFINCGAPGCNQSFRTIKKFLKHAKLHQKATPFECRHCCRQFISKSSLKKHVLNHKRSKFELFDTYKLTPTPNKLNLTDS
ncbi:unnamed protein product [Moneuplotes crassus]|uniref:C2H2-type domain-containing protein n=1 Tax=Euplotes crassus TaxID=5936 RepID=A0AAD1UJU1_EUPCR|nr:unnamed protein product [Moneuplotes crassus]